MECWKYIFALAISGYVFVALIASYLIMGLFFTQGSNLGFIGVVLAISVVFVLVITFVGLYLCRRYEQIKHRESKLTKWMLISRTFNLRKPLSTLENGIKMNSKDIIAP